MLVILLVFGLSCQYSTKPMDCTALKGQDLLLDFKVEFSTGDHRFNEQFSNDSKYSGKHLDLTARQIGDTLIVRFYKIGGNSHLECVEVEANQKKINITNYESNHLKEVTLKQFEYKILNRERLKLGTIHSKMAHRK
ncbi:MAG: hypothetical protein P1U56_25970 [Saprospiraceae bacterium]|nr:hypothetical protein [Saprospiraceae bacterium]